MRIYLTSKAPNGKADVEGISEICWLAAHKVVMGPDNLITWNTWQQTNWRPCSFSDTILEYLTMYKRSLIKCINIVRKM